MRNRRDLRLLAGILFCILVLSVFVHPSAEDMERDDPRRSTFLSGPDGARALLLTMEELGIPVQRDLLPWGAAEWKVDGTELEDDVAPDGADDERPDDEGAYDERADAEGAVHEGGADDGVAVDGADGEGVDDEGADIDGTEGEGPARRLGGIVLLAPTELPTPREVDALMAWIEGGGMLLYAVRPVQDVVADELGLRIATAAPEDLSAVERVRWEAGRGEGVSAGPVPHPWTVGVDSVRGFRQVFRDGEEAAPGAEVLLRTDGGEPAVITFPVGQGRVVVWSDALVMSNGRLRDGGAALLFARAALASVAEGGVLGFDEYHQGYRADGGPTSALWTFLTRTGPGRWLVQVAIAGLALLLLAGSRLGAPVQERSGERRSPLEHVQAVAAAYRKSRARRTARRLLLAGMNRQLHRRSHGQVMPTLPDGGEEGRAAKRLRQEWERGEEGDLVALNAAIDAYITEVRGWKRAS